VIGTRSDRSTRHCSGENRSFSNMKEKRANINIMLSLKFNFVHC
jgi:hypothetical protein